MSRANLTGLAGEDQAPLFEKRQPREVDAPSQGLSKGKACRKHIKRCQKSPIHVSGRKNPSLFGSLGKLISQRRASGTDLLAPRSNYPTACQEYIKGCQNSPIRMLKRISPSSFGPWKKLILLICNLIYGKTNIDQTQICQIEGNRQIIRTPQPPPSSIEGIIRGLPFDTSDVRDAITIAAIKSRPPDTTEVPCHVLIGSQFISDRIPADDQVKVTSFINKLGESGMFFFRDGVIKTRSGLQATVTYNTETKKYAFTIVGQSLLSKGGVSRHYTRPYK
jgi:hypothetical protein